MSCHGVARSGFTEGEMDGDKHIPSLANIEKSWKKNSILNMNKFYYSHKYINKIINVNENELNKIYNYMVSFDKVHNFFNFYKPSSKWSLFLDSKGNPASVPPWGEIVSIDLISGKINWKKPFGERIINNKITKGDINFGGLISTAGNIIIATGTTDKKVRIFNSVDGKELWSYKMKYSGSSHPMTFLHKKKQYIIVNASGGKFFGFEKGNQDYVYCFKIF